MIETPKQNDPTGRKSARLRLTLKNTSQKPMALVNLPGFCSLSLDPVSPVPNTKVPDWPQCGSLTLTDNDILVLQPEESRYYDIDLAEQQWQVLRNDTLVETGTLEWSERFRIVYSPPSTEASAALKDAALIWHGRLPSRAFHGRGNID